MFNDKATVGRLSSDPTFSYFFWSHPIFPTFPSKFLLFPTFCFGYPRAVSKYRGLLLKCVDYLYDYKGQYFSIISQFGAQYDIILSNLHSLNQIGAIHNEVI